LQKLRNSQNQSNKNQSNQYEQTHAGIDNDRQTMTSGVYPLTAKDMCRVIQNDF